MKKIIFFNILITLALFSYVMARWMHFPYSEGAFSLETVMVYGAFLMGTGLSLSNVIRFNLLLLQKQWKKKEISIVFSFGIKEKITVGLKMS
jgi:hypothetical protein